MPAAGPAVALAGAVIGAKVAGFAGGLIAIGASIVGGVISHYTRDKQGVGGTPGSRLCLARSIASSHSASVCGKGTMSASG